jgi:hypothetical protein
MSSTFTIPYKVYWRNPKTRVFERIHGAFVYAVDGIALEILPTPSAKWYTIVAGEEEEESD